MAKQKLLASQRDIWRLVELLLGIRCVSYKQNKMHPYCSPSEKIMQIYFFPHYVHIQLALPLAAQLSLYFCKKFENQLCCTSTRDLFKDAPLIVRDRKEKRKEEKNKPSFQWESNSGPLVA